MRIAFDATVSGRVRTGVGVYARHLHAALQERGTDARWWQHPLDDDGSARWRRARNGVTLSRWLLRGLRERCTGERIDVCHSTTSIGPLDAGCRLVLTVHDATTVTMPVHRGLAHRAFGRVFSVGAARRAAAILAPTHVAGDAVAEHYRVLRERVHVIPLGVNPSFHHVDAAAVEHTKRAYRLDHPYVLSVGANTPRKNLARLVEAMSLLPPSLSDLDLVVAGPVAHDEPPIERLVRRGRRGPRIRRLGCVPDALLPGLYAGATVSAYVSICEGFGLPIVEAMAAGTPVVTSNVSAMPEVAGGAALLVDPFDPPAIADGLERAATDSHLAADLRRRGRSRSRLFDWRQTAALTERAYHLVCGRDYSSLEALSPCPDSVPTHSPAAFAP